MSLAFGLVGMFASGSLMLSCATCIPCHNACTLLSDTHLLVLPLVLLLETRLPIVGFERLLQGNAFHRECWPVNLPSWRLLRVLAGLLVDARTGGRPVLNGIACSGLQGGELCTCLRGTPRQLLVLSMNPLH